MIKVFHKSNEARLNARMSFMRASEDPINKDDYILVAIVQTDNLDVAFRQTNHIDYDWAQNPDVIAFSKKVRSTSVDDILQKNTDLFIIVDTIGFKEIKWEV